MSARCPSCGGPICPDCGTSIGTGAGYCHAHAARHRKPTKRIKYVLDIARLKRLMGYTTIVAVEQRAGLRKGTLQKAMARGTGSLATIDSVAVALGVRVEDLILEERR